MFFGIGTVDVAEQLGDAAYLTVLLIIFKLALLQGASHTAIGRLGFVFLATEMCAPYAHIVFRMGMQYPTFSLLVITGCCMLVAKRSGQTGTMWELRVPQADNPVLWEAAVLLFIVRSSLPWAAANVVLMIGVFITRWGYMFACVWKRRTRVCATQTIT